MNRDPLDASIEQAKGKVREATGKAMSDDDLHTEGRIDQVSGKAPPEYGDAKERAKDNLDRL
ncbi:CsbD family protein [Caldimonas tepidiphila]|uniref:CsbD family protein n=1 Tax=Caldimonas tepidiphila TaxID=2315841 RepID=UPI000E5AB7B9|nr:CsbD family protein [Caldimonas tepidiphila]